jgi:hypothetical protein
VETVLSEADVSTLCLVTCCVLYWLAEISGPSWNIPLKPNELADILGMLSQLRIMVANLSANGQWLSGNGDRPQSRVKVGWGGGMETTSRVARILGLQLYKFVWSDLWWQSCQQTASGWAAMETGPSLGSRWAAFTAAGKTGAALFFCLKDAKMQLWI